jgi:hypothetical protein
MCSLRVVVACASALVLLSCAKRSEEQPSSTPRSASVTPAPVAPPPPPVAPSPVAPPPAPAPAPAPTRDRIAPSTPDGLGVVALAPRSVSLRWNTARDDRAVVGYEVRRGHDVVLAVAEPAATVGDLATATTHCFSVVALDAAGNRSRPTPETCGETPDRDPPATPAGVRAQATSEHAATVTWEPAADDVGTARYEVSADGAPVASVPGTELSDAGLTAARTRCYTVRALDRAGNASAPSAPACATTPDLTPPTPPTDVVATAADEHAVKLAWHVSADEAGVAGYEVLRAGEVVATPADAAAREAGLRAAHAYCYTVRARDAAGNRSPESAEACVTTPDLTPPTRPPILKAAAIDDRSAAIRWGAAQDEVGVTGYELLRAGESRLAIDALEAEDWGLAPAHLYCWAVRARDAAGNWSAPSETACARTPDLTSPTRPGKPQATAISKTRIAVGWSASEDDVGVARYEIVREGEVIARAGPSDTSALVAIGRGRPEAKEHCFTIRAVDAAANFSNPSDRACAPLPSPGAPEAPSALRAEAAGDDTVRLSWAASPDDGIVYAVYGSDAAERVGATARTEYTVPSLWASRRRCYRVAAVDGDGRESPRTLEACAPSSPAVTTAD